MLIGILVFLHHLGLWLTIGQSREMSQSNSSKMFALYLRVLGDRALSLLAGIDEGGRETLREEAVRIRLHLPRAHGLEQKLEVCCSPFSQAWPTPAAWLLFASR